MSSDAIRQIGLTTEYTEYTEPNEVRQTAEGCSQGKRSAVNSDGWGSGAKEALVGPDFYPWMTRPARMNTKQW